MKELLTTIALLLLTSQSYANAAQVTASDLVGTWKLIKSENPMPDGSMVPYCNGVHGYIIYTAEGHMSVSLNCGPRVNPIEPADISGRKFFYAGTYSITGLEVTHHLENASDVRLIGTDSKRTVTLSESLLKLSGINQGQIFSAYWEKIK